MLPSMAPRTSNAILLLLLMVMFQAGSGFHHGGDYVHSFSVSQELPLTPGVRVQGQGQAVKGLHLAVEGSQQLRVTWMVAAGWGSRPFSPLCLYGAKEAMRYKVKGISYSYSAGMFNHTLNTAVLDLSVIPCGTSSPSAVCVKGVSYRCGDQRFGLSDAYHMHFYPDAGVPLKPGSCFAVVGDMGVPHGAKTIDSIAAHIGEGPELNSSQAGGVQMLLHVGDISYADIYDLKGQNNSWVWVNYMTSMEKLASRLPYMTAPGNHEAQFKFAAYLNWLPMPYSASGSESPFWFSFDYLGVHVVMFSTEHDFSPLSRQHLWIQQDLERANEKRTQVPWIVVLGHRPLYCSSIVGRDRCHQEAKLYRVYLERLFHQAAVDVVISGHIHHYERSFPVYQGKVTQKHYDNPQAPVYIVNGGAGNPEPNDPTFEPNVDWRAWYNVTFKTGFLLMTPSRSQLTFDYVFTDGNEVVDSFTITKD